MSLLQKLHEIFPYSPKTLSPERDKVIACLKDLYFLLFPQHHHSGKKIKGYNFLPSSKSILKKCHRELIQQFKRALKTQDNHQAKRIAEEFLNTLPSIKARLLKDAEAAFEKDPAAHSVDEVILSYPGFQAIMTYRLAHEISQLQVPLIPRMMSEYAHSQTGCDIHPDAQLGESLFIDHGTGVVIGQTSVIGNRVTIFQGVTLGAIAMKSKDEKQKRHPTIEDDVILYSHATILGGQTKIGKGSVIGGSCWITQSIPADSRVIVAKPQMLVENTREAIEYIPNWDI